MKLINKNTDYAARALATLAANPGNFIPARRIAKIQKIPYNFLRQVLRPLVLRKIIISAEGSGGGMKLAVDPGKIRVIDLVRIYHKNFKFSECTFRGKPCSNRRHCALRKEVVRIEADVVKELGDITIKKLL